MPASKGTKPPRAGKGRPKGAKNKLAENMKDAIWNAFQDAQRDIKHPANLARFSKVNPEAFLHIASKLIPKNIELPNPNGFRVLIIHDDVNPDHWNPDGTRKLSEAEKNAAGDHAAKMARVTTPARADAKGNAQPPALFDVRADARQAQPSTHHPAGPKFAIQD